MLRHESEVKGYEIHASDGLVGTVTDFLFDDATWVVRWLVVDTGHWLPGRKVLLPPSALGYVNHIGHQFNVLLTRQQVKDCPGVEVHEPVSRQHEARIYDYYGWSPYWGNPSIAGAIGYGDTILGASMTVPPFGLMQREKDIDDSEQSKQELTLRSVDEITGYAIHAVDGEIGHVEDVLVEDDDWTIRYLVVETKNWWHGNKVLVSPLAVTDIRWTERQVRLGVDRQRVQNSMAYDPLEIVDFSHEKTTLRYEGGHRSSAR